MVFTRAQRESVRERGDVRGKGKSCPIKENQKEKKKKKGERKRRRKAEDRLHCRVLLIPRPLLCSMRWLSLLESRGCHLLTLARMDGPGGDSDIDDPIRCRSVEGQSSQSGLWRRGADAASNGLTPKSHAEQCPSESSRPASVLPSTVTRAWPASRGRGRRSVAACLAPAISSLRHTSKAKARGEKDDTHAWAFTLFLLLLTTFPCLPLFPCLPVSFARPMIS